MMTAMSFSPFFRPRQLPLAFLLFFAAGLFVEATQHDDVFLEDQWQDAATVFTDSADVFETFPDGSVPAPAREPRRSTAAEAGPPAPAAGQPAGALTGRIVFTSGGHGWTKGSSSWSLQRPLLLEMNEDYGNRDQMNLFAQYAFNAGATVVPMRPVGHQSNEVVINNVDPEVIWSGAWNNSSETPYYGTAGQVPYRWASLSPTETATATYVPDIPEAGFYPVYTWVFHGSDRTFQLYRIRHTGGESEVRVPHHMVGNGWVYLGTYYFDAGSNPGTGAVVISNRQPSPAVGSIVVADAIRFGNGMSTDGSTYPKEEEASRYWVKNSLGVGQDTTLYDQSETDYKDNVGTPPRMAQEMNREQASPLYKSIYIGFHTNASTGNPDTASARGVVGLHNGNHPGKSTPNQFRWAEIVGQEVNDQMVAMSPFLEVPWFDKSVVTLSRTDIAFGEINDDAIDGEFDATILESGYHDNVADSLILRDPQARQWIARAAYRAVVKYMNEFDNGPLVFLPEAPRNVRALATDSGEIEISWDRPAESAGSGEPTSYVVYRSTNGYGFGNPTFVDGGETTSVTLDGLPADTELYFRVAARNAGGESFPSATVGSRRSSTPGAPRVLVVNAYHRFDRTINIRQTPSPQNYRAPGHDNNSGVIDRVLPRSVNSFDYVVQHGEALSASDRSFDSCQDVAVAAGEIDLVAYDTVIWAAGQESVDGKTFTSAARDQIAHFLHNGGAFFASGSDIAYDLDRPSGPSAEERDFLGNLLKVAYDADDAGTAAAGPTAPGLFSGLPTATFDTGPGGIYPVRAPDAVTPGGSGAETALSFMGGGGAAIQYDGSAGNGRVVFVGFPFETITSANLRQQYMARILDFLAGPLLDAAPAISEQPESQSAIEGVDVVLSVKATGIPAPMFQWKHDGVDIPGANAATLSLDPVQLTDAGDYQVIVTNTSGTVPSESVTLTVYPRPDSPRLALLGPTEDEALAGLLLGDPGSWFLVETSVDLKAWQPLATFLVDDAPGFFFDPAWRSFDRRFYRAREVPVVTFIDFGDRSPGEEVLFREPAYPGPTTQFLTLGDGAPNFVSVSNDPPEGGNSDQVLHAAWNFAAGKTDPWLRLTTYNAAGFPNPTIDFAQGIRLNVYVDRPIYLALGIRETNPTTSLGENGGTSGTIEWVGGSHDNTVSPPLGRFIPAGEWTSVSFFIPYEPVRRFTGNGILESTSGKGVLENLTIVPADGTGLYNLFLDELRSVELFGD